MTDQERNDVLRQTIKDLKDSLIINVLIKLSKEEIGNVFCRDQIQEIYDWESLKQKNLDKEVI